MKILKQIWVDIRQGENIDVYLTIVGAIVLSALSLFGVSLGEKIAGVTLAVLALLAVNTLINRQKLDGLSELQTTIKWFQEEYPGTVNDDIESAQELWLVGYHLETTFTKRAFTFEEKLARKATIKILLLDPDADVTRYANESLLYPNTTVDEFNDRIRKSLGLITQFSKDHPANVEVRLSSYPLPFGAYAMNINAPNGVMYIEIYKYKTKIKEPHFVLRRKDGTWFNLYRDQLNALWENAGPYPISGAPKRKKKQ